MGGEPKLNPEDPKYQNAGYLGLPRIPSVGFGWITSNWVRGPDSELQTFHRDTAGIPGTSKMRSQGSKTLLSEVFVTNSKALEYKVFSLLDVEGNSETYYSHKCSHPLWSLGPRSDPESKVFGPSVVH